MNLVGDYLCTIFIPSLTPEVIAKMYETLETVAYEAVRDLQHSSEETPVTKYQPRLLTSMMSTLAKVRDSSIFDVLLSMSNLPGFQVFHSL